MKATLFFIKNRILNGEINSFQQKGIPYVSGTYKNGKKDGKWNSYNNYTGNVSCEETFEDGEEVGLRLSYQEMASLEVNIILTKILSLKLLKEVGLKMVRLSMRNTIKMGKKMANG